MNLTELDQNVLEPMKQHIPNFIEGRVKAAYEDVANLQDLFTMFDISTSEQKKRLHELNTQELGYFFKTSSIINTLHRSIIEFANIFTGIVIHEARLRPSTEWTIGDLAKQPIAAKIDSSVLQQAYCLYMYRNKLIAHHEAARSTGVLNYGDGRRQLWPMPLPHFTVNQVDAQELLTLQKKYSTLPGVASETNFYELLSLLYYSIPCPRGNKPTTDRETINKIAERGGCRSMSPSEIIKTIDDFSLEIALLAPL